MKQDIFNQYTDRISELFGISKADLFSKSKKRDVVDARHLLYFLCAQRPMRINYIQKYMNDNGYNIQHSSVIHGIKVIEEKIKEDSDYVTVIKDIQKSVFI
jgi:chromosomal replication initiation ATPase DnaA